jgi:hypothetical protein
LVFFGFRPRDLWLHRGGLNHDHFQFWCHVNDLLVVLADVDIQSGSELAVIIIIRAIIFIGFNDRLFNL